MNVSNIISSQVTQAKLNMGSTTGNLLIDMKMEDKMTSSTDTLETVRVTILSGCLFMIFIASCVGNYLVFLVFYKKPCLLTLSNRFITNLSVCNILTPVFLIPVMFTSVISRRWLFGVIWCQMTGFLMNTVFAASTFTLVAVSLDRYCAVVTPLHYKIRMTSQRSVVIIFTVWLVAILTSVPPLFGWNFYIYENDKCLCTVHWASIDAHNKYYTLCLVCMTFIVPLGIILWAYIAIFQSAKNNVERTRRNSIVPNNAIDNDTSQTPLKIDNRRRSSTAPILTRRVSASSKNGVYIWRKDEWKTALTSLLVVFTFIMCWFLYFIVIVLESVLSSPQMLSPVLESVSIILALSSCAFNPWVYVFRSKVARQELLCILGCRKRERETYITDSRRGSTCVSVRDGIIRQSSTESEVIDRSLHTSSTSSTLTSLLQNCSSPPVRL